MVLAFLIIAAIEPGLGKAEREHKHVHLGEEELYPLNVKPAVQQHLLGGVETVWLDCGTQCVDELLPPPPVDAEEVLDRQPLAPRRLPGQPVFQQAIPPPVVPRGRQRVRSLRSHEVLVWRNW